MIENFKATDNFGQIYETAETNKLLAAFLDKQHDSVSANRNQNAPTDSLPTLTIDGLNSASAGPSCNRQHPNF